jgi:hypothetical protein
MLAMESSVPPKTIFSMHLVPGNQDSHRRSGNQERPELETNQWTAHRITLMMTRPEGIGWMVK